MFAYSAGLPPVHIIFKWVIVLALLLHLPVAAQQLPSGLSEQLISQRLRAVAVPPAPDVFVSHPNYPLLGGLALGYFGAGAAVHIYQQNAWWKDNRSSFHFQNDWGYALWIDKVGHMYGTILLSHAFSSLLEAGGVQTEPSVIYGALGGLAFQLYVEVEDGFGPDWGFSPGDAAADVLGSAYSVIQFYYPYTKNFRLKFSYYPVDLQKTSPMSGQKHIIIDDYSGQKFWLSVKMKNVLPEQAAAWWPSMLNLALGMGVKDLDGRGNGIRDFYIAFDLDLEDIPLHGQGWNFVKKTLNYLHLPMPGMRITRNVAFFGLCF